MKISRNTKLRFLGFSIVLLVAMGIVVNIATANSQSAVREEVSSQIVPSDAQAEETPDVPQFSQTSCAMAIDDLGDNNPFTYSFSAVNTNNIASYSWDFGDFTSAGTQVAPKTYASAGSYTVTLTCTPNAGFGAPIVLTGSVFVSQPPTVGFSLLPGTTVTNNGPMMFSTNNTTVPGTSTYEWCVTTAPIPPGTFNGVNCPVYYDTTTNISFLFGTYATTHYVYLKATNAGETGIAGLSFVLNATAPSMNFTVSPASGPAPLTSVVTEIDNATGPVTSIQYTLSGPVSGTYPTVAALNAALVNLPAGLYTVRLDYAGPGGSGFVQRSILSFVSAEEVEARFIVVLGDMVGPNRRVCFINTSGGPVTASYWDFDGNGSPDITDIPAITGDTPESGDPMGTVCYVYPAAMFGNNINVKLIVVGSDPLSVNSEAIQVINIIAKPEASFTWNGSSPATIEWGTYANFTDTSTGVIDEWSWEFDYGNNGSIDATSTAQNPNNRQLPVGVNRVILTVRNTVTGEIDTVEHFITVTVKPITCNAIGGTFVINPDNDNSQSYTMSVNGLNGVNFGTRTATFAWTIDGNPVGGSTSPLGPIDWSLYAYGTHTIGVTVTTADGATCSREQTVDYNWEPVVCPDMTVSGPFVSGGAPYTFYPNNDPVTFTIPNMSGTLNGRAVLGYEWYVNGVLQVGETANTFVYTLPAPPAAVTVRYVVLVDNDASGLPFNPANDASCFEDEAFNVAVYPTPTCNFTGNSYGTIYADGASRTITVNAGALQNRTVSEIRLYGTVGAGPEVLIGTQTFPPAVGTSATFNWTNHTTWNPSAPDWTFRAEVDVTDGVTTNMANCNVGVPVTDYPTPTCTITGNNTNAPNTNSNRLPEMLGTTNAQERQIFNMSLNLNGLGGITLGNRTWSYPVNAPATILSGGGLTDSTVTVIWNATQASLIPPTSGNPATIDLSVAWTYPDGTPGNINCTDRNINVFVPKLVCNDPTGDLTPLPGDNNTYSINLTGGAGTGGPLYGRNHYTQWSLEVYTGPVGGPYDVNNNSLWAPVGGSPFTTASTPATQSLSYSLFAADGHYRIRYFADVTDQLVDNCTSNWVLLTAGASGVGFTCDLFYNTPTNNFTVADATGNQTVTVNVDNGNNLPLVYEYYMVGAGGAETLIFTSAASTTDGNYAQAIARALFAPLGNVGNYNMRVHVTDSSNTAVPVSCDLFSPARYIVGAVDANMNVEAYPGGFSGFAVGQCFNIANTSVTNAGALLGSNTANMVYEWTLGGGGTPSNNNQAGQTVFTTFDPFNPDPNELCFYDNGTYTITLRARNIDGGDTVFRQENTQVNNVRICDLQGLSIDALTNFNAGSKTFNTSFFGELTGNYTFTITNTDTSTIVYGPTAQAGGSLTRNLPAGNYRLDVSRGGCLGTASASYNFTLIGAGGIAASYRFLNNINSGNAGTTICFIDTSTTNGGSLNSWEWDFEPFIPDGVFEVTAPGNPNPCFQFNTPGVYRPRLRVGNTSGQFATAQNPVRIYSALEGQMSFTSTPQGGGAWCFTPNMTNAPAGTIVNYWEFDANQTPSPTQTPAVGANGSGVICHTYGSSGTYYVNMCFTGPAPANETGCVMNPVVVDLPGSNPPTLTTTQTCSVTPGTAQFSVTNVGPTNMPNPVTVLFYNNGVQFNSASIQLNNGSTQNFSFSGMTGVVQMVIGAYAINVNTTCSYPPILSITSVCSGTNPSYPVFTLNNANDPAGDNPMILTQAYTIYDSANNVIQTGNLPILPDGVSSSVIGTPLTSANNPYETYRVESTGTYGTLSQTQTPCHTAPTLSVTRDCANPTQFTINSTGALVLPQSFQVVSTGITGVIPAGVGGTPMVVTLTGLNPYLSYTVQTTVATQGFLTLNSVLPACTPPTLNVVRTCANPTQITVNSSAPLPVAQGFEVVGYPAINGTIGVGGSSVTLTLTGLDPYANYQVASNTSPDGYIAYTSTTTNCTRPILTVAQDCANPMQFIVSNSGGDMLMPSTVTYSGPGGSSVSPTTVQLVSGGNITLTVSPSAPTIDPYAAYSVTINDFNTNSVPVVDMSDCTAPLLSVTNNDCATYPLTFTVTNGGGAMLVGQAYEIRNSASAVVLSGTLLIGAGGNQVITMTGINPYDTYTISTTGYAGTFVLGSDPINACTAPVLTAVSDCAYPATFTISNSGGDMILPQSFTITHKDGTDMTGNTAPSVSNFDLNNGQQLVLTMDSALDPYGLYTLTSTGFAGGVTNTQDCELPRLQVSSSCVFPVQFLVKNIGADMPIDHSYTVTNTLGFDFTTAPGTFRLATDEVFLVNVPVTDLSQTITFATNTFGIFNITQITCISGGGVTKNPPVVDLDGPIAPTSSPINTETLLLNRLSLDLLGLPAWAGVPTCGHGCPIFRLYHTNQSGDWDIWRLDGADMETETTIHTNLTERDSADASVVNADGVLDVAPSLSPNNEWFVFASDRDGNWEIYVAPTSGDLNFAQRVTYNETAIDTDPTWGPNNYIVYESSRNGNWDLVMLDVKTGQEYEITDSPSNELNPAWSPDGSKIVYQSDVNSSALVTDWQVFELDLTTMTVRRLTSEPFGAVDPAYSPDGNRIVYRTLTESTNSVIKVMNGDLSGNVAVTTDAESATTPVFSPSGRYIAYQSNADGDLDIYVHEFATGLTRKLTDNTIDDFAPTWLCGDDRLVFTSEIFGQPDIFEVDVEPITAGPILVEEDAFRMTFEDFNDIYPLMNQPEENASREDQKVMEDTQYQRGLFRISFIMTQPELSDDEARREDWAEFDVCPASGDFAIGGG